MEASSKWVINLVSKKPKTNKTWIIRTKMLEEC